MTLPSRCVHLRRCADRQRHQSGARPLESRHKRNHHRHEPAQCHMRSISARRRSRSLQDTDTQIIVTSTTGTPGTRVNVTVTTPGGTSAITPLDQYTFVAAPAVNNLSVAQGPTTGGTSVTITGLNLAGGIVSVYFGAKPGTIISNTGTQIVATSPASAVGIVDVTVVTAGGTSVTSSADQFAFVPATRTWSGGGSDNKWSTPANWVGNVAPQPGDNLVFPAIAAQFNNVNDYPPGTQFGSITISGAGYIFHNGILSTTSVQVPSGTLTVDSIVADTLTIGAPSVATRTWNGGGTDNKWSTAANWVGNVAPLPGDNLVFPAAAAQQANVNDYPAGTVFGSITVLGANYNFLSGISSSGNIQITAGTLTASSIVCDTLTIGSSSGAAASTVSTNNANVAVPLVASVPQSVANEFLASTAADNTPIASTKIDSSAIVEQPTTATVNAASALATPSAYVQLTAEAPRIAPSALPGISTTITPTEIASAARLLEQWDRQQGAIETDLYLATRFDNQSTHSFSGPSLTTDRPKDVSDVGLSESLTRGKKAIVGHSGWRPTRPQSRPTILDAGISAKLRIQSRRLQTAHRQAFSQTGQTRQEGGR